MEPALATKQLNSVNQDNITEARMNSNMYYNMSYIIVVYYNIIYGNYIIIY